MTERKERQSMNTMFEAVATDFPFVAEMPKREKSRLVKAWETFQEISRIAETEGTLIPQVFAAKVLDLSTQRISQLCNEGKLKVVVVGSNRFVTEKSVLDWARGEHKAGRPLKVTESKTPWRDAARMAREIQAENRRK